MDRGKIPLDIILETVRSVKIHSLFIQQVALKFNMNYHALNHYCKKPWICDYQPWIRMTLTYDNQSW